MSAPAAARTQAPAPPVAAPAAEVVRVGAEHHALLAEFFRASWDPAANPARVRTARRALAAANPVTPGAEPPTWLFLADGRPVGHVTTIPVRLHTPRGERGAHWLKGLMVLPGHRNGPVGFLLLRQAVRELELAMAMVVAPEARRLFGALGFADLGALPNAVRLLRPERVLARLDPGAVGGGLPPAVARTLAGVRRHPAATTLAGATAAAVLGGWAALRGRPGRLHGVVLPEIPPDEADALWRRARRRLGAAAVRDGAALHARYAADGYRLLGVRDGGRLVGFAAVRPPRADGDPRLGGTRVATLSEIVFPTDLPAAGLALLAAAETVARSLDADALLCSASHPALAALLRRRAFLPFPGNVHLLVRESPPSPPALPRSLRSWWLTRGDSSADEVF